MEYLNILFSETYKILFLLLPVLVSVAMIVWLDRRIWAFVQKRKGPNVVGPFGLLQSLADALKYIFKEEYISEKIFTLPIDYYHSNVIARSSKTMNECRNIRTKLKKTGTEG